jgi:hypothetical protein
MAYRNRENGEEYEVTKSFQKYFVALFIKKINDNR